ncbi:EAL domain-containing protein [Pseudodesulfovibrio thermohalotolerans]|uniref:EAL and HDOD domain-containing protein n=1 Tax=Pseudodesulfovibrio thermohalotolerans TaxID=2880651 RepID=UPI0024422343|nr:EAL domain-containing protein [Pseudodesulfovibrio thermohalotolerans]WFS62380.1 EAL domain-containing protein [Pseudodesulfovibrio thermohalotolerans]
MRSKPQTFESMFIARQPVFRHDESVWGYELLFRSGRDNEAVISDESQATASVIADGLTLATEGMSPEARVLINFPEKLLGEDAGFALPKDRCVIEILEHVRPDKKTLSAVRRLKEAGYTLAVDDFLGQGELRPFIDLADIVKLDILALGADPARIRKALAGLPKHVTTLAEKVEDNETFRLLRDMGFSLFQGFFFSRPEIIPGRKLTAVETTKLQILGELAKPAFEPARLADILQSDPNLTYRLFRYINSAGFGLSAKITSAKRAIDMMGMIRAKQWLRSVILADLNPSPKAGELSYLAVHRAKFLESVCFDSNKSECEADTLFMIGLFSLLDAMLGMEMRDVLKSLPLEERVVEALNGTGDLSDLLHLAISYERGQWDETARYLEKLSLNAFKTELIYIQSRTWTQKTLGYSKSD